MSVMTEQNIIKILLGGVITCALITIAHGSHFRGSIIQWRTLEDILPGQEVMVEFTYRIGWRRSYSGGTRCDQNTVDAGLLTGIGGDLQCRLGCEGIRSVTTLNYFCTDFSPTEDWTVGERSFQFTVPPVPEFQASFTSGDWIRLVQGGGNWEVRVKMNFNQTLATGRAQNASPQTKMSPVIRLQRGCNHTIVIPVEDMDGDDVRCRWAESSLNECAGVCKTFPAELNQRECVMRYTENGRVGYYAVALQIEDFISPQATEPMSSVPLQFLVFLYDSEESCYSKPDFDLFTQEDGACVGVPPNATFTERLTAVSGGPGVEITAITTQSPQGMIKSELTKHNDQTWYVNMTWTPTENQKGPNIFCYVADDSTRRTSDQRCITILGGVFPPEVVPGSMTPTGRIYPDHNLWTLKFNLPIYRPTRAAYIRFFRASTQQEIYKIDASTSPNVEFSDPDIEYKIMIRTDSLTLIEKEDYFLRLDDGIAVGREFCGPENPRIWNVSFWMVTVRDVTPPKISYNDALPVTQANVTIGWSYDEAAASVCVLQSPTSTVPVDCTNHTYQGYDLDEGHHILYIQASDAEGNSKQYQHRWYVDLTEPIVNFIGRPNNFSSNSHVTFTFSCSDFSSCTYNCKLDQEKFQICSRSHSIRGLEQGRHELTVYAIDQVGNEGMAVTHKWYVDKESPTLQGVNNVTVSCGDSITPTYLGLPTANDKLDPYPNITYVDVVTDGCRTLRQWTAKDQAGNSHTISQIITFANPAPPKVTGDSHLYIACGSVDTIYDNEFILDHGLLNVTHPCERDLDITFRDSAPVEKCGVTITRSWTVKDDCGGSTEFTQDIIILKQSDPDAPEDGQINVPLTQTLSWPQYPGASHYKVYIWHYGDEQPTQPVAIVASRYYNPVDPYPPNTQLLWYIGYTVNSNGTSREIPSPVWGMKTKAFPDLAIVSVTAPSSAFSGNDLTIQWRVENVGNVSTSLSTRYWMDEIYIGPSNDISDARPVHRVTQRRYVDPADGFLAEAEISIDESAIGNFFIFVRVDIRGQIEDYSRDNNIMMTNTPIKVQLTPPPNLEVDSVTTLGTGFSGQEATVGWKVKNTGLGITQTSSWVDAVYLSEDMSFDDTDILLRTSRHQGELVSNAEYTTSVKVVLPNAIFGMFTIFVVTDVRNNVYEHADEDDNRNSAQFEVSLSPTPDLVIKELEIPADSFKTGETLMIEYTVRNQGAGSPFERWWTDKLTLTSISSRRVYHTAEVSINKQLPPGEKYTQQITYRIPQAIQTGNYNVSLHTDNQNLVFEYDKDTNNVASRQIQINQALPDLMVEEAGSITLREEPDGTYLEFDMSIMNVGKGHIFDVTWADAVYLSAGVMTSPASLPPLERQLQTEDVTPGASYRFRSAGILLPQSLTGDFSVYIATDTNNDIVELKETNNLVLVKSITIPKRQADLVVAKVELGTDIITAGENVLVTWDDVNEGNLAITAPWYDSVYLSRGERIDGQAILLGRVPHKAGLLPDRQVSKKLNITIPGDLAGLFNIIVRTGEYIQKVSESNNFNNAYSTRIQILTPPSPNFRIDDVEHKTLQGTGKAAKVLSVTVKTTNYGNSILRPLTWSDRVSLRERTIFAEVPIEVVHTTSNVTLSVLAGESYTVTHLLVISAYISGYFDLFVEVDSAQAVKELHGELDNSWVSKDPLMLEAAPFPQLDTMISRANLPSMANTGDLMDIQYTTKHVNGSDIPMTSWTDGLYLYNRVGASRREILDRAINVGSFIQNAELKTGGSIQTTLKASIPHGISGDYYMYIIPDVRGQLRIPPGALAYYSPDPLTISPGPLPDLTLRIAMDTLKLQSGQAYSISATVENIGNSSASGVWYDTFYLSEDPFIDPFDITLKTIERKNNLLKDATYDHTADVFIPYDLAGSNYYIIGKTNVDELVFESNAGNNAHHIIVSIQSAPAVDILVKDVTHSKSSGTYLDAIRFQWKIENNGSESFNGYKCDTVYFSPDEEWNIDDVSVSGPTCASFKLNPKSSSGSVLPYSASSRLPQVAEGKYRTIVRTRNNARDLKLDNNIGMSSSEINITPPILVMQQKKVVSINENDNVVLKIQDIPIGIALQVTLETTNAIAYHQMYLKAEAPPKPYDYDSISKERETRRQVVYISYTKSNTYYILVESISSSSRSYQVTLNAFEATFSLTSVFPPNIASFGSSTIRLNGMLFGTRIRACLKSDTDSSVVLCATKIDRINSEKAFATFEFNGVGVIGSYSIELEDLESGEQSILESGLSVEENIGGKLEIQLVPPSPLVAGRPAIITCHIHNTGYNDILTPVLVVASGGNSLISILGSDPETEPARSITFLPTVRGEPGDVIPPKTSRTFVFRATPSEGFVGDGKVVVVQAPSTELARFVREAETKAKPRNMEKQVWSLIYSNFIKCIGTTRESIEDSIRVRGSILNKYSPVLYYVPDILTNMLLYADGRLANTRVLRVVDIIDKLSKAGSPLMLERRYSGSLTRRRSKGLFGPGWTAPWLEVTLEHLRDSILLTYERTEYEFFPTEGGKLYKSPALSEAFIIQVGGAYEFHNDYLTFVFEKGTSKLGKIYNSLVEESIVIEYGDVLPVRLTHTLGSYLELVYNQYGVTRAKLFDSNDILIQESKYIYDDSGFLAEFITGDQFVSYTYTNEGDLGEVLYPSGDKQLNEYDDSYFLSSILYVTKDNVVLSNQTFEHSCDGGLVVTEHLLGVSSRFYFGVGGGILAHEPTLGLPVSYEADPVGNAVNSYIGDELFIRESFDSETKISTKIQANGDTLHIQLNDDGYISKIFDSTSTITEIKYNNEVVSDIKQADDTSRKFEYDGNNRVKKLTLEDESIISYNYDSYGNVISRQTDREKFDFSYTENRRISEIKTSDGITTLAYTSDGLPSKLSYPDGVEISYAYNQYQQRTQIATNTGYAVNYFYDQYRRLSYMEDKDKKELTRFTYDHLGRLSRKDLGNGHFSMYKYDAMSLRLAELVNYNRSGSIVSSFKYTYNKQGYRTMLETTDGTYKYTYDASGQLLHWEQNGGIAEEFHYDNRQNRITDKTSAGTSVYNTNSLSQYTSQGSFMSFKYDKLGNLVERSEKRGRHTTTEKFSFDQDKHLTRSEVDEVRCEYKYNVFGAMSKKTCTDGTESDYIVDPFGTFGAAVLIQTDSDEVNMIYHAMEQGMIGMGSSSSGIQYYLFNGDGSVSNIVDKDGIQSSSFQYDPFGKPLQGSTPKHMYTFLAKYGTRALPEVSPSVYVMGARVYDARLGRFISMDPLGATGSPTNPYSYANNNPLSYHDPHGLVFLPLVAAGAVIGAITGAAANAISQGISIAANGGSISDFSLGDLGGAALSGGITGAAITTGAALPALLGGGALATAGGFVVTAAGGAVGGFAGSAASDALNGRPFNVDAAQQSALMNGLMANIPWAMLKYGGKGSSAFGSPYIGQMRPFTPYNPYKPTGKSIWTTLGLGNALGLLPGLWPDSWPFPPWSDPPGGPDGGPSGQCPIPWIQSLDPNDILGPPGYGDNNFIPPGLSMEYTIRFENDVNATAPAQRVTIKSPLDANLDITTFRLGSFGFGELEVKLGYNSPFHQQMVNDTAQSGTFVFFQAGFDVTKNEATWLLQTIDTETGLPPSDPRVGFLPPNNGTSGQGYVTFSLQHKENIKQMARIDATASIIFDENGPIETPSIFHTVDRTAPNVSLDLSFSIEGSSGPLLNLLHTDSGSGVKHVDVYSKGTTGLLLPLIEKTNETTVLLPIPAGMTHTVAVIGTDYVGNVQPIDKTTFNDLFYYLSCPNNCSDKGSCGRDGVCLCEQGFFGQDCSAEEKTLEPPIIEFAFDPAVEDNPLISHISARAADPNSLAELSISITQVVPRDTRFQNGTESVGTHHFSSSDFGILVIIPPKHFSGLLNFTITAIAKSAEVEVNRDTQVSIPVSAVANAPTLNIYADCLDKTGKLRIDITAKLVDDDGSEVLRLFNGARILSQGVNYIDVPSDSEQVTITVTAESTEKSNGDSAKTELTVTSAVCDNTSSSPKPTTASAVVSTSQNIFMLLVISTVLLRG